MPEFARNAADVRQIRQLERRERERERQGAEALRAVMSTPEGRFVCWRWLERTGVFRSVWEQSARIHYNAGRQDVGHEFMAAMIETDENLYLQMEREARDRDRRDAQSAEAVTTPSADEGEPHE